MIDPTKITNFNLDDAGLEEHLLFWIAVAGKTAKTIAPRLAWLLDEAAVLAPEGATPFEIIRATGRKLKGMVKRRGIGCFTLKSKGMMYAAKAGLDLRNCTVEELDAIPGVGLKTAKCFIMHSRKDSRHAGLDTHVLRYLSDLGFLNVPQSTPAGSTYKKWETKFLELADAVEMPAAEFDLMIWRVYSGDDSNPETLDFLRSMKTVASEYM